MVMVFNATFNNILVILWQKPEQSEKIVVVAVVRTTRKSKFLNFEPTYFILLDSYES
jgi:hypothetical protein